jgi:glycosyltransferase involved in cell wall biosynthesis
VVSGDGQQEHRDERDGVQIVLDPLIGEALNGRGGEVPEAIAEGPLVHRLRLWAMRGLLPLACGVRWGVRRLYAGRRRLLMLPWLAAVIRWVGHAVQERRRTQRWASLFERLGADVYMTRCAGGDVALMQRACRQLRRKFVYMVASEMDVSGTYARSSGRDGILFERGLRQADLVICQHDGQARLIKTIYRKQGRVMRSVCPMSVRAGRRHVDRRTVLWVARLEPLKQPELILELARRLPEETFVMVAPLAHRYRDYATQIFEEARSLANLRLVPGLPFEDTAALFEDAKVLIHTSRLEGFPNTFLQAAACGTPIVSWSVNPEGMLERYGVGWCAQQNDGAFEAFVRRLCTTPALREAMGERGRQYVGRFHDPATVASEYRHLFQALIGGELAQVVGQPGRMGWVAGGAGR